MKRLLIYGVRIGHSVTPDRLSEKRQNAIPHTVLIGCLDYYRVFG